MMPSSDMIGSIFQGMFSESLDANQSSFTVDPSCPTGNCTFPAFQTLAVCSICIDITSALTKQCYAFFTGTGDVKMTRLRSNSSVFILDNFETPFSSFCEYSLPNGLKLNETGFDLGVPTVAVTGSKGAVGRAFYPNAILNISTVYGDPVANGYSVGANVTASQCYLYWCIKTLEVEVLNGKTEETEKESWSSETAHYWNATNVQESVILDDVDDAINANTVNPNDVNSWAGMGEGVRLDLQPPPLLRGLDPGNFTIAFHASAALTLWMRQKLELSTSIAPSPTSEGFVSDFSRFHEMVRLVQTANMTKVFQNIAKSMTYNVRIRSLDLQRNGMDASI